MGFLNTPKVGFIHHWSSIKPYKNYASNISAWHQNFLLKLNTKYIHKIGGFNRRVIFIGQKRILANEHALETYIFVCLNYRHKSALGFLHLTLTSHPVRGILLKKESYDYQIINTNLKMNKHSTSMIHSTFPKSKCAIMGINPSSHDSP